MLKWGEERVRKKKFLFQSSIWFSKMYSNTGRESISSLEEKKRKQQKME